MVARRTFAGLSAAFLAVTNAASAADAPVQVAAIAPASVIEEIVVTARKREERLQSVPISITAFTPAELETKGVRTLADLRYVAPSVSIQPDTFRQDTINITIRGLRNFPNDGIQYDTAAAVYVNGIYLARTQGLTGALLDVESVQVLKGPQGTLIGRNATGGAVLYTTREPDDVFGGYLNLTGGDYGRREGQGAINIPLQDSWSFRAALSYSESAGYLRNIYFDPVTRERNDTPGLGYRKTAGQFTLKYAPDNTFKIVLRGDFDVEHDTGTSYHNISAFEGTVLSIGRPSICNIPGTCNQFVDLRGRTIAPYFSDVNSRTVNTDPRSYNALLNSLARQAGDFWSIDQAVNAYNVGHFQTMSATIDKKFGDIDVRALGGYRWYDTTGISVSRGAPFDNIENRFINPDYESYTSELTVNGRHFEDRLKWTTGFFFFTEDVPRQGLSTYLFSVNQPAPQPVAGRQITLTDMSNNSGKNTSYAGYAQATYDILADLRLTGGVRYTVDERRARIATTSTRFPATATTSAAVPNSVFDPGTFTLNGIRYTGITRSCALVDAAGVLKPVSSCFFDVERTFRKPTWTVSLDYDVFDKTLVYVTARKGYRSGAINTGALNAALTVAEPETVQDYEAGVKSDWTVGGMALRTNIAGYLTYYHNIQAQISLPNVIFATGPGGGACTQTAFNAGQCTGTTTDPVTLNAKSAKIYGGEWDITAKPIPQLTLSWNGSYLHAYYTDFTFTVPAGYLLPATGTNLSGTPFPLPQWTMSASATLAFTGAELGDLPVGGVSLTANWYWQSDYKTILTVYNPAQKAKGYSLANFRLAIDDIRQKPVSVAAFVNNAFNKKACYPEPGSVAGGAGVLNSTPNATFGVPNTSGIVQCVPLPPRMFGVTLKYAF